MWPCCDAAMIFVIAQAIFRVRSSPWAATPCDSHALRDFATVPHNINAMTKLKKVDLRLAVGSQEGPRSSVWRCYSNKSDVYLTHGAAGGIEKISLHASLICRRAFTSEEGPAAGHSDRVILRWQRAPALPGTMAYALIARFPSDYLSTSLRRPFKPVQWLPPAPAGGATIVEFVFTGLDRTAMNQLAVAAGRTIVNFTPLPNGESFVVSYCHEPWQGEPFVAPGFLGRDGQYVVAPDDPSNSGRPARITLFLEPTSAHPMLIIDEFGAFHAPLDMQFSQPMGRFSRNEVLKSGKHG